MIIKMKLLFGLSMQPPEERTGTALRTFDLNIYHRWIKETATEAERTELLEFSQELRKLLGENPEGYIHAIGRFIRSNLKTGEFTASAQNAWQLIQFFDHNPQILEYFKVNLHKLEPISNSINEYIATEYQAKNKRILPRTN